jgi:ABC-type multidrug transport system ATPase subunit
LLSRGRAGVDAEVGSGEAVAVVGPNGSGKSTLLRCVAGMDRPSAGTIRLCGRPMRERDPQTRRSVAAVLDDVEFFADLAVAEHLALLMSAHGDAAPDEHAADLPGEAGLAGAADQLPAGLSSGQRRRLALATCFARPTVTRPPLDYNGPLVPTPFGDYPLALWLQVLRGPLLLAVLTALTTAITAR